MIVHQATFIHEDDVAAVLKVLRSRIINSSDTAEAFAQQFQRYLKSKACVTTSTGTLALVLALRICGLRYGDDMLIPSYVCNDVLAAVRLVGARPRLVDCSPDNPNMDPIDAVRKKAGCKAVIIPHLFGRPAMLEDFADLGLKIIEDCSHALGGEWHAKPIGSYGDVATFSFHPLKMISSGEGGMVSANTEETASKLLRTQNPDYDKGQVQEHYHLSNILAALGVSQFTRLHENVSRRREISKKYLKGLHGIPRLRLPLLDGDGWRSSCMRFVLCHESKTFQEVESSFLSKGVIVRRPVKHLLHTYKPYRTMYCPQAAWNYDHAISLPLHLELIDEDVDKIVNVALEVFKT
jgi:dTDP-4-amino-4,6-dideoxygalactose transaminase